MILEQETYLECPCQASMIELFVKIVNNFQDYALQDSNYTSGTLQKL